MTATLSQPVDSLTAEERSQLEQCEGRISRGIGTFREVGEAIAEIITARLYREQYATSDAYLSEKWGMTRQHANRLISAAHTASVLEPIGLQPENERQAREMKKTAAVYEKASPAVQQAFARLAQKTTGTQAPSNMQMDALGDLLIQIDAHGVVDDPDTGEQVKVESLAPERLDAVLRANLTTATYETTKRQETHIKEKLLETNKTGRGGWADWLADKGKSLPDDQEIQLVSRPDPSGNPVMFVRIMDVKRGIVLAVGESASYAKKAVLNFIEEHGK